MSVTQLSSAIHNSSYFPAAIDVAFVKLIHLNDHLDDVKKLGQNLGQTDRQTDIQGQMLSCFATKKYWGKNFIQFYFTVCHINIHARIKPKNKNVKF